MSLPVLYRRRPRDHTTTSAALEVEMAWAESGSLWRRGCLETAIAVWRTRTDIHDPAGWVVYLLRQRRDHGWTLPLPTPISDGIVSRLPLPDGAITPVASLFPGSNPN